MSARPTKPWYEQGAYTSDVALAARQWEAAIQQPRARAMQDAYELEFLYERDRYYSRGRRAYQFPSWVHATYEWLRDEYARPSENIVKSRVDALTSLLLTEQPAIEVSVGGARFEVQRAARARSNALNAIFNQQRPRQQLQTIGRNALIAGVAGCWPVVRGQSVEFRPIRIEQLLWNPHDVRYDDPTELGVCEFMDRREVLAWLDSLKRSEALGERRRAVIRRRVSSLAGVAPKPPYEKQSPYDWDLATCGLASDRLEVVHLWRTATSVDADDGRYVVIVRGGGPPAGAYGLSRDIVCLDVPFGRTSLPVSLWSPWPPLEGLIGTGYACQLVEQQRGLDQLWQRVMERSSKLGWPMIVTAGSAPLDPEIEEALKREGITVITAGPDAQPGVLEFPALSKQDLALIDVIKQASAQTTGVNQVLAGGQTQLGAGASGVALAEEADRQVDRFSDVYETWSTFRLSVAREMLHAIEDAVRLSGRFATRWRAQDGSWRQHSWEDLARDNAEYALSLEEAGVMARTRAGRLAKIMASAETGLVTSDDARRALLGTPDMRGLAELSLAGRRRIEADLDELAQPRGDHTRQPTPDHELPLAVDLAGRYINLAADHGAETATLERLAGYRRAAQSLLEAQIAEAQLAAVQAAGAAQAQAGLQEQGAAAVSAELAGSVGSALTP